MSGRSFRRTLCLLAALQAGPSGVGYGVAVTGTTDFVGFTSFASLGVYSDGFGNAIAVFQNSALDVIDFAFVPTVTGNIVLELNATLQSDSVSARYSTDGGANFFDLNAGGPITVTYHGIVSVFGYGAAIVPVPAALPLLASALMVLAGVRSTRRKT